MNNCLIIVFMGMDGSGKSTLSNYLYEEIRQQGVNVSHNWWLEGENSSLRRLIRWIGKQNSESQSNHNIQTSGLKDKKISSIFYYTFPWLVLLDYLKFTLIHITIPKKLYNKIMIFDRFYGDVVISMYRNFNISKFYCSKLVKIYKILAGTPDIIFCIDVKPELALARKKDEIRTIDNAKKIWEDYQEIYSLMKKNYPENIIDIDGNDDLKIVKSEILKYSKNLMGD